MKPGKPLQRRTPLHRKPIQQIRAEVTQDRDRDTGVSAAKRRAQHRREDTQWRKRVLELRGGRCRSCGSTTDVQVDHMVPRSPDTRLVIANGLPLCGDFGTARCHPRKTAHQLLIERDWLDPDQVAWLEQEGHATWGHDGVVSGTHFRLFADTTRR